MSQRCRPQVQVGRESGKVQCARRGGWVVCVCVSVCVVWMVGECGDVSGKYSYIVQRDVLSLSLPSLALHYHPCHFHIHSHGMLVVR